MSLGPITQHEWLNRNSLRAFPVVENAVPQFANGDEMPHNILVDSSLVASLPGPGRIYVSSISFTAMTVTVVLADIGGTTVGYATGVLGSTPPNTSVPIQSPDGLGSGTVTFGRILDPSAYSDYGEFLGIHTQSTAILLDERCYLYTGKPMVESIEADLQDGLVDGNAVISLGNEMQAEVTTLLINGVQETQVELSLVNPENFLPDCYPIYVDPLCFCGQTPIITVNGVPRDEDGDLGIDIVFGPNVPGEISNEDGQNLLELTLEQPGDEVCVEDPVVPDQFGRLGPDFGQDCPPDANYGLVDSGPDCQNPPLRPPVFVEPSSSSQSSEAPTTPEPPLPSAPHPDRLLAHYDGQDFADVGGGIWYDSSGNGHDAALLGPAPAAGETLEFGGTSKFDLPADIPADSIFFVVRHDMSLLDTGGDEELNPLIASELGQSYVFLGNDSAFNYGISVDGSAGDRGYAWHNGVYLEAGPLPSGVELANMGASGLGAEIWSIWSVEFHDRDNDWKQLLALNGSTNFFKGAVAEILLYSGTDIQPEVEAYLNARWGHLLNP